jgi:hypothetical protein
MATARIYRFMANGSGDDGYGFTTHQPVRAVQSHHHERESQVKGEK